MTTVYEFNVPNCYEECGRKSNVFCIRCNVYFCHTCRHQFHSSKSKVFSKHEVLDLTSPNAQLLGKTSMDVMNEKLMIIDCPIHNHLLYKNQKNIQEDVLDLYCITCKKWICPYCANQHISSAAGAAAAAGAGAGAGAVHQRSNDYVIPPPFHNGHTIESLKKWNQKRIQSNGVNNDELLSSINKINLQTRHLSDLTNQLNNEVQYLEGIKSRQILVIESEMQKVMDEIGMVKDKFCNELNAHHNMFRDVLKEKIDHLDLLMRDIQEFKDSNISFIESLKDNSSFTRPFAMNSREFEFHMMRLLKSRKLLQEIDETRGSIVNILNHLQPNHHDRMEQCVEQVKCLGNRLEKALQLPPTNNMNQIQSSFNQKGVIPSNQKTPTCSLGYYPKDMEMEDQVNMTSSLPAQISPPSTGSVSVKMKPLQGGSFVEVRKTRKISKEMEEFLNKYSNYLK